jgi:AcrR family transcriptional regulator
MSDRRAEILEAAALAFFEHGYAATSIDAIIARVGGSKRNIYNEFGSKQGLFAALVSEIADGALSSLDLEKLDGDLEATLRRLGHRLAHIYLSPSLVGVYRIMVAEGQRFPTLARAFYDKGPGRAVTRLAEVLQNARHAEERSLADCMTAADVFVGMLRGNLHLNAVLALHSNPTESEIATAVESAVDIFLHGFEAKEPMDQ